MATNKLASTFGTASATFAFWHAGKVEARMAPAALASCLASALGALALPWAPRALLIAALPVVLVDVAIYFTFAPHLGEVQRPARMSPALFAWTPAPAARALRRIWRCGQARGSSVG